MLKIGGMQPTDRMLKMQPLKQQQTGKLELRKTNLKKVDGAMKAALIQDMTIIRDIRLLPNTTLIIVRQRGEQRLELPIVHGGWQKVA